MNTKTIGILFILALIQFTNIVDFMIMMPLGPILKSQWNITSTEFSRLVSVFGIGSFISAFINLGYINRFPRKQLLLVAYGGFTIFTFLCSMVNNYNTLLIVRFLTGAFGGLIGSIVLSIMGDLVANEYRGRAMGILLIGFSLASVVGVPAGLWIAGHSHWNTPFIVLSVICFIILFLVYIFIPRIEVEKVEYQNSLQIIRQIFSVPNYRVAYLLSFTLMMSHFMIIPFLTDYITFNLGFSFKTTVPSVYILGGLLTALASPLIGWFSDLHGRYKVLIILSILAIIPALGITNLVTDSKFVLFIVCATLFIFSGSRMIVVNAQITGVSKVSERGAFMLINSSIQQIGVTVAAIIGGAIIANGPNKEVLNYPILGILAIVLNVCVVILFPRVKIQS